MMGIKNFFEEIKIFAEGISNANKQLYEDVKEITVETKRDIIADWKREVPPVGNAMDKVDRTITTIKNITDQLPDPSPDPFNPNIKLKKIIKKAKKAAHAKDSIKRVQHLKVNRLGYSHHALSISAYEVIHYQDGIVKIESIESFSKGASIQIVNTPRLYKKDEVIARAYSKLGEKEYNILFNNCEHFVRWAMYGD